MSSPKFGAQPRANEPVVGRDGLVTQAWRDYFARLAMAQSSDDLRQLYEALAARVAELAEGHSLRIVGRNSVSTAGASVVEIQLVGDEAAPGNTEYYGTGPTGQRGFFPIASAIEVDPGELEKSIGPDGIITLGLADVPDEGGGTLQKTAFDAKGRKTGTSEATTTDLSEGTNLYYTDERAAAAAPVQSVNTKTGAVVLVPADIGLADGTTGQFWRGDGAFTNQLTGGAAFGGATAGYSGFSTVVTVEGSLHGAFEVASRRADAHGVLVGAVSAYFLSASDGHRRIADIQFTTEGSTVGKRGGGVRFYVKPDGAASLFPAMQIHQDGAVGAGTDNVQSLGEAAYRWSVVYAGTGTINTSDAREKTSVRPFTAAELAAGAELGRGIGVYQWLAMVDQKGDAARQHIGLTVQRAIAILESHGLDPFAYGFICYDQWSELPEIRDEEGEILQERRPAGDRYSFRMDELLAFIARGLAHRLDAMEQRLAAAGL